MNISPISFAGTTSFQEMVAKPQTYIKTTQPAAATSIKKEGKKHKGLKIAAGIAGAAAIICATLALGAKHGIFNEGKNKTLNSVKKYLKNAGDFINNKFNAISDSQFIQTLKSKFKKAPEVIQEAAEDVIEV